MNQSTLPKPENPNAVLKASVTLQLAEMIKRVAEKRGIKIDEEKKKT